MLLVPEREASTRPDQVPEEWTPVARCVGHSGGPVGGEFALLVQPEAVLPEEGSAPVLPGAGPSGSDEFTDHAIHDLPGRAFRDRPGHYCLRPTDVG